MSVYRASHFFIGDALTDKWLRSYIEPVHPFVRGGKVTLQAIGGGMYPDAPFLISITDVAHDSTDRSPH